MNNYCTDCGHRIYQHSGTRCQHVETVGHIVKIVAGASTGGGWTMKHPVAERENDKLFDCPMVKAFLDALDDWPEPGEYAVFSTDYNDYGGGLLFQSPDRARQQCDCGNVDSVVGLARAAMDGDGPSGMYTDYDQACLWCGLVRKLVAEIETP